MTNGTVTLGGLLPVSLNPEMIEVALAAINGLLSGSSVGNSGVNLPERIGDCVCKHKQHCLNIADAIHTCRK